MPTVEEEAQAKAKEEADAKAKVEAEDKAKADAEAKAKAEADARAKQGLAGYSEEQWSVIEKQFPGLTRNQILATATITKAMQDAGPQAKFLEKEALRDAKEGFSDFTFYEADVKKELEKLTPQERQNSDRVKEVYFAVKGRKISEGKGYQEESGRRRISSGVDSGGAGGSGSKGEDLPDFGKGVDAHDREEVFNKFNIKDKEEYDSLQASRDVPVKSEVNWKPIFK